MDRPQHPLHDADVEKIINDFNTIRSAPPSMERSKQSDEQYRRSLHASEHLDMFVEQKIIFKIEEMLSQTEGSKMFAMAYLQSKKASLSVSNGTWKALVALLHPRPFFIQFLARNLIRNLVLYGSLLPDHLRELHALLPALDACQDDEAHKRRVWIEEITPKVNAQLFGPTKDQFVGCFIGCCTGDSSGFPVEGKGHQFCQTYADQFIRTQNPPKASKGDHKFGQITDDSQLARELIRSIVVNKGQFDPQLYANHVADMFREPFRIVGMGKSTLLAATNIQRGVAWTASGCDYANSNGSSMRAGPIGVMFFHSPATLARVASDQATCTHNSSLCRAGAVAVATAAKLAVEGDMPCHIFCERLAKAVNPYDLSLALQILGIPDLFENRLTRPQVKDLFVTGGIRRGESLWEEGKSISPGLSQSTLWAIYSYLSSPNNFLECISIAIEIGGDVDTTAAMAGSICGARVGLSRIPTSLWHQIHDREEWTQESLLALITKAWEHFEKNEIRY